MERVMDKQDDKKILIDGEISLRKGVYANLSMAKTSARETILEFAMIESVVEDGTQTGVLQSRVIMSNEAFVEFAQMIADHLGKNFEKVDDDE